MKKLFVVFFLFLLWGGVLIAQPPVTEAQARAELEKRGLDEQIIRQKMLERGIDVDNIDKNNPTEVLAAERALEEVIKEIEAEKAAVKQGNPNPQVPPGAEGVELANPAIQGVDVIEAVEVQQDTTERAIEEIKESDIEATIAEEIVEEKNELPASPIFGQHIFRNKSIKLYRQSQDVKPPDSYVLGAGDIIAISIWGASQTADIFEINKSGFISPTAMPRIYLKGISLGKAKELLFQRYSQFYRFRKEEFEVSINYSRTITVNIVGEVLNFGSFTIPATNTAFNALVASGGPSDIGSVRNIKLMRAGEQPKNIDIYEFLLNPSVQDNFYLQENDYIHVPVADRLISVAGAVKRPFTYELVKGENLMKLIEFAGGLQNNAYTGNFQITRIVNDEEVIIDVNYKDLLTAGRDFDLLNGDKIVVKTIPKPYKNFTEITGAVEFPGRYEHFQGMKISDLLDKGVLAEGSRTDIAFMQRANLDGTVRYLRINLDDIIDNPGSATNVALLPQDKLIIYTQSQFTETATFSVVGAVRNAIEFPFDVDENIKVEDAILMAGGVTPDVAEYAYIKRIDIKKPKEREYIRVNLQNALLNPNSNDNLVLKPFDELRVYSKSGFLDDSDVAIDGAVRNPGSYAYDDGLKVSDLIYFAKGLRIDATDFAYLIRTDPTDSQIEQYIRLDLKKIMENPNSAENINLAPFDRITVYSKMAYIEDSNIRISGAVRTPGEFKFAETFTLKDALTLAGGLKLEASKSHVDIFRIVIKDDAPIETIVATVEVDDSLNVISGGDNNFQLQPFDHIVVRSIPDFDFQDLVSINGEVMYPGTYPLIADNEKLLSIIQRAGGLTNEAFPDGATLYRSDGGTGYVVLDLIDVLKNSNSRYNFILKEGDVIEIPKAKDLVTINGATKAIEIYPEKIALGGKFSVAFHKGKNAKWYVEHYAAGVGENGKKKLITVEHPNGEIEKTKNFLFFKDYPSVREGSVVTVGTPPPKAPKEKEKSDKEKVDWGKTLADSIAQATAILALVVLIQQINR